MVEREEYNVEKKAMVTKYSFEELEFNFIPLYETDYCKKNHYMLDPPSYKSNECLWTYQKRY
jgi:hypothetical protein